jgi:DNA-binding NtrC family response regulator
MSTVLVVDDKEMLRDSVGVTLQRAGFTVIAAGDGEQALGLIARRRPDVVITDLKMPGMTGLELLERVRELDDDLPVVLMTAYGAVETAVKAMKLGAYTYLTKPFEGDELIVAVKRAIEHAQLKRDNAVLRLAVQGDAPDASASPMAAGPGAAAGQPRALERLIGQSPAMRQLKEQVSAVARSHGTALIHGESGVGKEVVARAIHEMSPRSGEAFLALNCAAMSESLLESELFGHEKGAFTGAERLRKGRFELSDRGTLLLDEISEISPRIQAKLLRVLQERAFERVGSSTTLHVDVRVLATTNRELPRSVAAGEFRQDLYFRLNVLPVHVPALRQRMEDVPLLARHFVAAICSREGIETKRVTDLAVEALTSYPWPGNVRELQNICERAVVLSRGPAIDADLLRSWLAGAATGAAAGLNGHSRPRPEAPMIEVAPTLASVAQAKDTRVAFGEVGRVRRLEDVEREAIIETLIRFKGHRQKSAEALGIGVRTLGLKLKKWKEDKLVSESL